MTKKTSFILPATVAVVGGAIANVSTSSDLCTSIHGLQCYGDDIKDAGWVSTHMDCCNLCMNTPGCAAWTWNWNEDGHCWVKHDCTDKRYVYGFHSGMGAAPGPTPPPPPTPPPVPTPPTSWQKYQNTNCYSQHGADPVDSGDIGTLTLADCQAACQSKYECQGIVMEVTCDPNSKVKCWRYTNIALSHCSVDGGYNLWLNSAGPSPVPAPTPSPSPRPPATCTPCPALHSFDGPDDEQYRQNCPNQERFQWIKDLIKKGCNQVWNLEEKTYYIDRQYLLPCGVQVKGTGQGKTIIKAVRCETPPSGYGIGTEGAKYRIGFVMNTNTMISDLSFEGADEYRYSKQGSSGKDYSSEGYGNGPGALCHSGGNGFTDLQGGGAFETPGCPDPYACGLTPCINGKFTTPAGYTWEPVSSIAVRNVVIRDVDTTNVQNGFFGAPLFPEHLGVGVAGGFDVDVHRPSNIQIVNFHSKMTHADGINLHGNFEDVLIDRYIVDDANDDCIALWSYRDKLGNFTIRNSEAHRCGYQGCYVAYGGKGPYTYSNNECSGSGGRAKCLWLDGDMFNGQFDCESQVSSVGATCYGGSSYQECVQRGTPKSLCPYSQFSFI